MLDPKILEAVHDIVYHVSCNDEQEQEAAIIALLEGREVPLSKFPTEKYRPIEKLPGKAVETAYAVYDLETTGLDTSTARIVELACKVVRGAEEKAYSWLILQSEPLPDVTVELTGITDEMCASQGIALHHALAMFAEAVGDLTIVGHNAMRYDDPLMAAEHSRCGLTLPPGIMRHDQLDTAALFKARQNGISRREGEEFAKYQRRVLETVMRGKFNLEHACASMGVSTEGIRAHRAAGDVELTDRLFRKLHLL